MGSPRWLALLGVVALAAPARAFTVETLLSDGCHERLTRDTLAGQGWPGGRTPPSPTDADRRLAGDQPFSGADSLDPWALALVLGARDADLRGTSGTDLVAAPFAEIDDGDQPNHCLRRHLDDDPGGDARALAACADEILRQVDDAIGPGDAPDLDARVTVTVPLVFEGPQPVSLPRFPWVLGHVLHAIQDSYAHDYRSPDGTRVRTVANYIDWVRGDYDPARDGPRHMADLDACSGSDVTERNAARATEASRALFAAIVDDSGGNAGRHARAAQVIAARLIYESGCEYQNAWCGVGQTGCAVAPGGGDGDLAAMGIALLCLALAGARRRRRRLGAAAILAALLLAPSSARAAPSRWWLTGDLGVSLDHGAASVGVGAQVDVARRVSLGFTVEANPWFSWTEPRFSSGSLDWFATLRVRWAMFERVDLWSAIDVGGSTLLTDLAVAPAGTTGVFLGGSPLGVSVHLGPRWNLVIDPGFVAAPAPQLRGLPFVYLQHRLLVGVQWNL